MTPLPYTVIGGFLGAGKTTLVNHWLRHADGQRMAVLVNDFGALNIDAALIASSAADTTALIELTNGCVCCQIGDDLTQALIQVLDRAAAFDAVVVEASGVADPWRIAQMGRADPGLRLDGVIVLVDASTALTHARDPRLVDTLERQLRAADLIVVNKCDAADDLGALHDWIASVAGAVPRIDTTGSSVPLALLRGPAIPHARLIEHEDHHDHGHDHSAHDHGAEVAHGDVFETWSARPERPFDPQSLRAWLREPPAGLLRLKGVLQTGAPAWSELQFAGRRGTLRDASAPVDGAAVVAIGLTGQLPRAALERCFGTQRDRG